MVNILIPVKGYVHLYRSLLRFYDMPENEIKEMLYLLNTANVDCYGCYHPERYLIESAYRFFRLARQNGLPSLPDRGAAI